jgi:hypothetical protein
MARRTAGFDVPGLADAIADEDDDDDENDAGASDYWDAEDHGAWPW